MDDKQKPVVIFTGQNGNIFNLLSIAQRAMKKADLNKEVTEMLNRVQQSHSYEESLTIIGEYCKVQ